MAITVTLSVPLDRLVRSTKSNTSLAGYGITTDGNIIYVNASTCNINYTPRNPAFVFDIPIPEGFSK